MCFQITHHESAGIRQTSLAQSDSQVTLEIECVAVCCSVLQCVAVCCRVSQCVTVCCSVLQCIPVCCSVLQCVYTLDCTHVYFARYDTHIYMSHLKDMCVTQIHVTHITSRDSRCLGMMRHDSAGIHHRSDTTKTYTH